LKVVEIEETSLKIERKSGKFLKTPRQHRKN
jgi:hypothetical protein